MKNRNYQREDEKNATQPDRELGKDGGGLRPKKIICQSATKSGTQAFAFGSLHENSQNHQKGADDE